MQYYKPIKYRGVVDYEFILMYYDTGYWYCSN